MSLFKTFWRLWKIFILKIFQAANENDDLALYASFDLVKTTTLSTLFQAAKRKRRLLFYIFQADNENDDLNLYASFG
jgi:hypothetical protein